MKIKNDGEGTIRTDLEDGGNITEYQLTPGEVRDVPASHATKLIMVDSRIRLAEDWEV